MYEAKYESKTKIKTKKLKNQDLEIKNFYGPLYGNVTGKLKLNQDDRIEVLVKVEDEVIEDFFGPIEDIEEVYDWFYEIASDVIYDSVNNELVDNGIINDDVEFLDFKLVDVQYND